MFCIVHVYDLLFLIFFFIQMGILSVEILLVS